MVYKDPEKKRATMKAWLEANNDKRRAQRDRKRYGITREDMIELLGNDNCAICERNGLKKRNAIDHCGEVTMARGFLCTSCNTALGLFKHRPDLLRSAAEYLERPPLIAPERYARLLRAARDKRTT